MKRHIELDRRFYRIDEKAEAFPEDTTAFGDSEYITQGWDKLVDRKRVVVLAEAGMGKSEELRTQAQKLPLTGKPAFYARIERLADVDFNSALEHGTPQELEAWRAGEDVGYFFLDSVDEARLTHKRFRDAAKAVAHAIEGGEERAHIFISSRPSDWRWTEDIAMIKQLLPVRSAESSSDAEEPAPLSDEALLAPLRDRERQQSGQDEEDAKQDIVTVVKLLGLTQPKIEKFAKQRNVTDIPAFMRALGNADAMTLVARPQDLDGIIDIWNEKGHIGTHSQALRGSITQRLRETNLDQADLRELSEVQALQGARRVAAALTLSRASTVAIPGGEQEREGALDVATILPEWTPKKQKALLSRGIFDPATFGRVRFHHREVQELLTADWLLERLEKGCPQETIEELLATESHGFTVIRPSMRPVAAWVGQQHEGIRERLVDVAPEVLIEGGDPSLIPIPARVVLLERFADRYRGRKDSGTSINIDNVKRLADTQLASAIERLWHAHPESEDVRELLLRLIWSGAIQANASIAQDALQSPTSSEYERRLSLRALSTAGSAEQRRATVALTVEQAGTWRTHIVAEAIDAFYPEDMTDEQLTALIQTGDEQEAQRATGLGYTIDQIAARVPVTVLERLLPIVMALVRHEPHASEHVAVSAHYEWLLESLATICERLLPIASGRPGDLLSEAVELLGQHAFWRRQAHVDSKQLSAVLRDEQLTRHFFWRTFADTLERLRSEGAAFEGYWQFHREHPLWQLKQADFEWLVIDVRNGPSSEARRAAVTAALNVWSSHGRGDRHLAALREAVQRDGQSQQVLEEYLNPAPRPISEQERRYQELREEQQREGEENRQRREQSWLNFRNILQQNPERLSDREAVAAHSNFGYLWDIAKWLRVKARDHSQYGVAEWELIESAFGRAVAEAARDGLATFWRTVDCEGELQSDQSTNGSIVALVGIAIDARNPRWAVSLTDEEARRATKIAFKELNGLPPWMTEIFEHKQAAAAEVLRPLIANELCLEPDHLNPMRVLERLTYAPVGLRDHMPPIVLGQLEQHDPLRPDTLRRALRVALASSALDRNSFSQHARGRIVAHHNNKALQQLWLAALLCVDADAGVSELQRSIDGLPRAEADQFVLSLLNTLYDHRDASFGNEHADFLRAEPLVPFLTLVLAHVRRHEDNEHDGSYSPDARDEAEQVRGKLLERFTSIPGRGTVDTLLSLREKPEWAHFSERILVWAERRAAEDGDLPSWQAADVADFEERFERPIRSSQDLYEVACNRLANLKHELEHDDFSSRDLLRQDERPRALEELVQKWFARELKKAARHHYTVHREEEVIDGNEPDIRVASERAEGPTSIEIKVADSWEFDELTVALEEQLVGKYMRARHSRYGILLLTWHGKRQTWTAGNEELTFDRVMERLRERGVAVRAANTQIDRLSVVGIDLTRGSQSNKKTKKARPAKI